MGGGRDTSVAAGSRWFDFEDWPFGSFCVRSKANGRLVVGESLATQESLIPMGLCEAMMQRSQPNAGVQCQRHSRAASLAHIANGKLASEAIGR
jgi:hypothetical protein